MRIKVQAALEDETEILYWPDNAVNLKCLDALLREAHERKLPSAHKLSYYRHVRLSDDDFPDYVNRQERRSVSQLRKLYTETRGRQFNPAISLPDVSQGSFMFGYNPDTGQVVLHTFTD